MSQPTTSGAEASLAETSRVYERLRGGPPGGGGPGGGDSDSYSPEEISRIFQGLRAASESFFSKDPGRVLPEEAVRHLIAQSFSALAETASNKEDLLRGVALMVSQADDKRIERQETAETDDERAASLKQTAKEIWDCLFPRRRHRTR